MGQCYDPGHRVGPLSPRSRKGWRKGPPIEILVPGARPPEVQRTRFRQERKKPAFGQKSGGGRNSSSASQSRQASSWRQ